MKKINDRILHPGDIILTTTNKPISKIIQTFTSSDISHAMLYVENYSIIDATEEGVQSNNTQRIFIDDSCAIYALRYKHEIEAAKIFGIVNFVRQRIGTPYSTKEAIFSAIGGKTDFSINQFCSRLIAQAYFEFGIQLVENVNYCTPEDIKNSSELILLENSYFKVPESEMLDSKSRLDLTELTRSSTNYILKHTRSIIPTIKTLSDVDNAIIGGKLRDKYVLEIYKKSKYFDLWKLEQEKNPWRYNGLIMESMNFDPRQLRNYCLDTINNFEYHHYRLHHNFLLYDEIYSKYKFETFFHLLKLYDMLVKISYLRLDTAQKWCDTHDIKY